MKRLTLAGLAQEKEEVLKQLAFFGAVEIHDAAPLATEEEAAQYGAVSDTAESGELRGDLEKLQGAIHALTPLAPKKGLLQAKPHITRQGMEDAIVLSLIHISSSRPPRRSWKALDLTTGRAALRWKCSP